jgi:hypothetical protein
MTDQTSGQPAEGALARPEKTSGRLAAAIYAGRDVALSLAPYALAVYSIWQAVQLNDASFTKGLVQGLFAAALLAINPRAPHKDGGQ